MGLKRDARRLAAGALLTHIALYACAAPALTGAAQEPRTRKVEAGSAGVSTVSAEVRCDGPRDFHLDLKWRIDDPELRHRAQFLEFSLLRQDFDSSSGRFHVEVDPGVTSHSFRASLATETVYHWRVRLPAAGKDPEAISEIASFVTSGCPGADFPDGSR